MHPVHHGILDRMRVCLLYFGVLKDLLGAASETVEAAEGASVGDVLRILRRRTSNQGMEALLWDRLAVAVNRQYASLDTVLMPDDEVALLPPVSGGGSA
jgi:molybdopterin converting factor small subunit